MSSAPPSAPALYGAVLVSGVCGLTWEVLWQHHAALALGVSAFGTAVTLAALMTGLGMGGLLAVRLARTGRLERPLRAYAWAELAIGIGGLCVPLGLAGLGSLDTFLYAASPTLADVARIAGSGLVLLLPATAMGATIPLLAPIAEASGAGIARIYATNVAGAVVGVLLATFLGLPRLGVTGTAFAAAGLNGVVAIWAATRATRGRGSEAAESFASWPPGGALVLAAASGFGVFALEVAWFRSLRALLQSTTESFAIILGTFLLALSLGGVLASWLRPRFPEVRVWLLPLAAASIVVATPLIDTLDQSALRLLPGWVFATVSVEALALRFGLILAVVLVPVSLLGTIFPWLLADHATTTGTGRLTAVNTLGAVAGALFAAFVLLPSIGATRTGAMTAAVVLAGCVASLGIARTLVPAAAAVAVSGLVLVLYGAPAAQVRAHGLTHAGARLLFVAEGPDTTVQVAEKRGVRALLIDGFGASGEGPGSEYMEWMGHLPVMAAPSLQDTLVICFGVGHTANAVRRHAPESLTVVDVNQAVLDAADYFPVNQGVLHDERVHPVAMDGRAFLRRAKDRRFDLVTLEPMAPNFAGTNNLYSREFYQLVRSRLAEGGVAAQWLPIHLVSPEHMLAITRAFYEIFSYTRLWVAPGTTVILVGGAAPWELAESSIDLSLPHSVIEGRFALDYEQVATLVEGIEPVTDDNQKLSYGYERFVDRDREGRNWAAERSAASQLMIRNVRRTGSRDESGS